MSIAILSQLICFFYLPNLSTDYYRFLWDGELLNSGINPYDFTPNEYALNAPGMSDYMKSLHQGMGRLSASNYSCYPTINQLYFYLSTIATDTISSSVFVMRSLIFLTQLIGGWACLKILELLNKNPEKVLYLFLNPLLVIECSANLHFEGVMLSFILLSIYFMMKTKTFLANSFFALAIHI
ncbi:MAG: polyprenol phosphomannose-dependent alpha 1,6 mannosyltransferase MptB, partial [Crocinitomicaceae bacterium]